jgi:hypothetical protein
MGNFKETLEEMKWDHKSGLHINGLRYSPSSRSISPSLTLLPVMRTLYGKRDIKGFVGRQTHLSYLP